MSSDKILIKRGSRAQIEAAASIGLLNVGEPYLITDEDKIAVGTSTTTFSESALPSDVTFETLSTNGDIGTASDQLATGDHSHSSFSTLRIGTETNYSEFEADGTLVAHGDATYWVDVDFPIIIRTTGPNIPVLTTLKGNIIAPQWDVNDYSVCEGQEIPHFYKEGSPLYWHLHTVTNTSDTTNRYLSFEIEMVWANLDGVLSDVITLSSGDLLIPANTPQYTMIVFPLNTQSLPSLAIGAHIWTRLKRVASTGTAPSDDPWVTMLQSHIECDTFGSRQIGTK